MKRILLTIAISAATSLLTLAGGVWFLGYHSIPLPNETLDDGTTIRREVSVLTGCYDADFVAKDGHRLRHLTIFHYSPEQNVRCVYLKEDGTVRRVEVTTRPSNGVAIRKVYRDGNESPVCSSVSTGSPEFGQQKKFFDAASNPISEEAFKALLDQA